jgi:hypothetical protein
MAYRNEFWVTYYMISYFATEQGKEIYAEFKYKDKHLSYPWDCIGSIFA